MVRVSTAAAISLLLLCSRGWAAEEGYRRLLDDPAEKTAERVVKITKDFNAAIKLLEAGSASADAATKQKKFEEARVALERVVGMKPGADLARKLRNSVKEQVIAQVFLEAPTQTIDKLKEFLSIAEAGRREWLRDKERIAGLVVDLTAGEFDKMWIAIYKLKGAGQHAAPQLLEKLKSGDRDERTKASMALIASGGPVVLPLSEALKTNNDDLKQEIVFILSQIGDARGAPALAAVAFSEASRAAKDDALEAVKRITAGEQLKSAPVYYLDQAEAYYQRRFEVLQRVHEDYIIWDWDREGEKLIGRTVPEYAFYLEMAEKLCYEAINLSEYFDDAYSLLICVYYQQFHTCTNLLAAVERGPAGELTEAEIAGIRARNDRIVEILRTAPALGKRHVYGALKFALADGNVAVAVSCADTLRQLGSAADLPIMPPVGSRKKRAMPDVPAQADPLVAALDSSDKQVRYHAAAALAGLADRAFEGMEKVIPILCQQALGERGARVALVADSDVQVVNQLKGDLKDDGYIIDIAHDPREALNVGYSVPMKDALIIDASFKKAIDTFLVDYRSRNVPIILLTNDFTVEEAKAAYEGKVAAFVPKPVNTADVKSALFTAFVGVQEDTGKTVALGMNYMAAKALANVDVDTTVLPMDAAVDALIHALELPDEVRLEAMKALSNIAPQAAQPGLSLVAADTGNSLEARLAAVGALTAIAIEHGGTTQSVQNLTEKLLLDEKPAVRSAAARLIGAATRSNSPVKRLMTDAGWVTDSAAEEK